MPDLSRYRSGLARLRGLRCIHTHLKEEGLNEEDLTDLALLRLDLMCAITTNQNGLPSFYHIAHLLPVNENGQGWRILEPIRYGNLNLNFSQLIEALEEEFQRVQRAHTVKRNKDRAILIHVSTSNTKTEAEISLMELSELAYTAGVEVVDKIIQYRKKINPKFFIGKGKLAEVVIRALQAGADLLIFDHELNPSQVKAITSFTDLRVIDRTQLILDIFAQRARSREGKIQVEIAQLKYLLPRLVKQDASMSRLAGGIGGRGPGETKLEIDRRRIKKRLHRLQQELKAIRNERKQRRIKRKKANLPIISIIGYTNSGKSTLLNALTKSNILTENKLFATLDPTSRRLRFPNEKEAIITDTVGFIRNLPKDLIEAFAATLEELKEADLLIHLIDISNPHFEEHIETVEGIIDKLNLTHIPVLKVFNKKDLVSAEYVAQQCQRYKAIAISAIQPETLPLLVKKIENILGNFSFNNPGRN
ncbi:MAG: GTPase HflX [Candidatus Desulfofervidus auxilii]|nr:GTPase HflX [Candidatus Desulfofervidus auxilii]